MNIAIYMPFFILLFFIVAHNQLKKKWHIISKPKGEKGYSFMSEYLKKYIGKKCFISTGAFDGSVQGRITAVEDKWIEIEVKESKPKEIVNLDFVQRIRIFKDN